MRQLEQRAMWSHGTPFVVRRVPSCHGVQHFIASDPIWTMTAHAGFVIFAPCGKFLARVRPDQLKRWLNYFGKQELRK